jgi:hypothetical protein
MDSVFARRLGIGWALNERKSWRLENTACGSIALGASFWLMALNL